ncbi:hypothetical protein pv_97 [Pithovirus sibericum]|uniref:Uncharacterized protein n=1 Tax=Pithovirus sibericum TaxID=1450746 RepID=W5S4T9_9VIRU|nr:hypothetical protein pv_97 [Pithovirus sibericum]AHH01664.1 hypothetical protein pv_97 [Pithovirus sibericum]
MRSANLSSIFEKFHVLDEVLTILSRRRREVLQEFSEKELCDQGPFSFESICIIREIEKFISSGHAVNTSGLVFATYLQDCGIDRQMVFLAHKISELDVTNSHFSLLAEEVLTSSNLFPPNCYESNLALEAGLKSFISPRYRRLRLCLAILLELNRISIRRFLRNSLQFSSIEKAEKKLSNPLILLLIKACVCN